MGSRKTVKRDFGDTVGLDITRTALNRAENACISFKNIERLEDGTLRGREGLKLAAQPLYIRSIFNYVYVDSNGVVQEELLGVGCLNPDNVTSATAGEGKHSGSLFRLKTGTFTLTYSGGDASYYARLTQNATGSRTLTIDVGTFPSGSAYTKDLGSMAISSPFTLQDLADEITAVTDWSASVDMTAIVNGAQAGVSTVTVDSGHTIDVGDWIEIESSIATNAREIQEVVATTSTSITFFTSGAGFSRTYSDNAVVGHGLYPAAVLDINPGVSNTSTGDISLSYTYWEPVPGLSFRNSSTTRFPFNDMEDRFGDASRKDIAFENDRNCVFFTAAYAEKADCSKFINNAAEFEFEAGVWKYDGYNVYLSGPITAQTDVATTSNLFTTSEASTGSAMPAGDYKYQISFVKKDGRGNVLESFIEYIKTQTQTATKDVDITITNNVSGDSNYNHDYFDLRYTTANGTVSSANTSFTVASGHTLRTGDYVYFYDNSSVLQERRITGWTNTTITLDVAATIANTNAISNCKVRAWRTKINANEFFLAHEEPVTFDFSTDTTFTDSTTDANLGIALTSVKEETIQYNFPRANSLTLHQGLIVLGGGPKLTQQIGWQDPIYPESLDYARNVAGVPTKNSGGLSALISHSNSSLIIAKADALYEAVGSFGVSDVEISRIVENSYGSNAVNGIAAIRNNIYGVCNIGFWGMSPAKDVDYTVGDAIATIFRELQLTSSEVIKDSAINIRYDTNKQWLHIFLPIYGMESTDNVATAYDHFFPTDDSRYYVIQLPRVAGQSALWSQFEYDVKALPGGGSVNHNGKFYTQSRGDFVTNTGSERHWTGYLYYRPELDNLNASSESIEAYLDNGATYDWEIIPQWETGGAPEYDKSWHEFRLYKMTDRNYIDQFTVSFVSYRDWDDVSWAPSPQTDTSRTTQLVFANLTNEKTIQFDKGYKAKVRTFRLSGTISKNPPVLNGYSFTVDEAGYDKDRFGRES